VACSGHDSRLAGMELLLLKPACLVETGFALALSGSVVVSTVTCVVLVVSFHWGVLEAVVGKARQGSVSRGAPLGSSAPHQFRMDTSAVRQVLKHTLPIVPGYWLGSLSAHISRFFLFSDMGAAQVAILRCV